MTIAHLKDEQLTPTLTQSPCLTEALRLAALGWHIFPVVPGTKKPYAGTGGVRDATTDRLTIEAWWHDHPEANIGVSCGASGIVALDVDLKTGGPVSMATLVERFGALPETVEAETPSGGLHLLYAHPGAPVGNRVGMWPGVDVRADRGYIVVAPSVHPNGLPYRWKAGHSPFERKPAPMPPWLLDALTARTEVTDTAAIREGERNATLTRLAGALRAQGVDEGGLIAALRGLNTAECRPPLPDAEVVAIARSIGNRPAGRLTERPRSFALLTRSDLGQLPSIEWLVDSVVPATGLSVLYGPSGAGKTFAALSMAYAVAVGIDWLGRGTLPGPVVYIAAEGRSGLRSRIEALERVHGLAADSLYVLPEAVQLGRERDVAALEEALTSLPQPPALIIVDTLARCLVGGDENSAKDVGLFVAGVDRLRETFECAVLVVHHSGKAGDSYRGSSALVGAADAVIRFEGHGGILTMHCEKLKDAEHFDNVNALLMQSEDSCLVVLSDGTAPTKDAPATRRVVEALAELRGEWITRPELAKRLGYPSTSSTIHKAVRAAHGAGFIEVDTTGKTHKLRAVSE